MFDLAARLAHRGAGRVEPGALVGCVIARGGTILGMGHHRRVGGLHAEAEALRNCAARGHTPAGATVYVTLEPCAKPGRNPPCAPALIAAQVGMVRYARTDPNPLKAGGAAALLAAGIPAFLDTCSPAAVGAGAPFAKRIVTGLPWVVVKWGQTIDGRAATRTRQSQWITGKRSRVGVHQLRARVDAVVTGVGTVLADDPLLTPRGVPLRSFHGGRTPLRVVLDTQLRTPLSAAVVRTARAFPTLIVGGGPSAPALAAAGAMVAPARPLRDLLAMLSREHAVSTVLVEAGPTLVGAFLDADLVDELHVYTGPLLLADADALPAAWGRAAPRLSDARRFALASLRRRDDDVRAVYRRVEGPSAGAGSAPNNPA
jgi:diaminohydroxyphosphoribosylaminopyrimidine deaminase/5-amino-6-(5-phosphoribosylamino)uracil reductase